jgi:hypothetical protein
MCKRKQDNEYTKTHPKRHKRDPEKERAYQRKRRQEQKTKDTKAAWRKKYPEKEKAARKRYHTRHIEKERARQRAYYARNKEDKAKRNHEYYARKKLENPNYNNSRKEKNAGRSIKLRKAEYDRMLHEQGGVCAICQNQPRKDRRLCIDHDHSTGAIRSLLCVKCNAAIGLFNENTDLMSKAIEYLKGKAYKRN